MNTHPPPRKYLSPAHIQELRESGLTDETIALAEIETQCDQVVVHERLNWPPPKRHAKNSLGDCLAYPCFVPGVADPYGWCVKPTYPRKDKRGKVRKYEAPKDRESLIHFPPRSRKKLKSGATKIWTEGVKKGLLLDQLGYTTVALTGVNNAHCTATKRESGGWQLHPVIRAHVEVRGCDHVILPDSDLRTKKPVMHAALVIARMLLDAGARSVRLAVPPQGPNGEKFGVDDYYMHAENRGDSGARAVAMLIETAEPLDPGTLDTRPRIVLHANEHEVVADAIEILASASEIFTRGHQLVRVQRLECAESAGHIQRALGAPTIEPVPRAALRMLLTREARVVTISDEDGTEEPAHPPTWLVDEIATAGHWPGFRPLIGVADSPIIRADGTIVAESGYHAPSGILLALPPDLEGLQVDSAPSRDRCGSAAAYLLRLVSDIPIASDEGRAAWLAGVLTPFIRDSIDGSVPLFFLVGSTPGTGKGLAIKVASLISTGRDPGATGYVQDAEEMAKRYTSAALAGDRILWLDDIVGSFGDAATNRVLTSPLIADRILGTNNKPVLLLVATPYGAGNNVQFVGDTIRRIIPIRIVSDVERPEERTDFRHPDLLAHVRANREKCVRAALTVLRGYLQAGCPCDDVTTMGSYESWRRLVAGAVKWSTGIDPIATRRTLSAASDPRLEALRALLRALQSMGAVEADRALRARDILERLRVRDPDAELPPVLDAARNALDMVGATRPGTVMTPLVLGMVLRPLVDRAVALDTDGKVLARLCTRNYHGIHHWWVGSIAGRRDEGASGWTNGTRGTPSPDQPSENRMYNMHTPPANTGERGPESPASPTDVLEATSFEDVEPLWSEHEAAQ